MDSANVLASTASDHGLQTHHQLNFFEYRSNLLEFLVDAATMEYVETLHNLIVIVHRMYHYLSSVHREKRTQVDRMRDTTG